MAETRRSKTAEADRLKEKEERAEYIKRYKSVVAAARRYEVKKLNKMTNAELLKEAFKASEPDWYDNEFTTHGEWYRDKTRKILMKRLGKWLVV